MSVAVILNIEIFSDINDSKFGVLVKLSGILLEG